jgi:hypothetical protein
MSNIGPAIRKIEAPKTNCPALPTPLAPMPAPAPAPRETEEVPA